MRKPELSGRIVKRSVHLSGYDLRFEPRVAIKSQALADFVSDFYLALQSQVTPRGPHCQADRCEFKATNNEAEYEALILGLQLALDLKIRHLKVYNDSQLILNHVNNSYAARDSMMMAYLEVAKELKLRFATFDIKQIPWDQNIEADALAALAATFKIGTISTIPIVHVLEPTISKIGHYERSKTRSQQLQKAGVLGNTTSQEEATDWRKPYQDWLQNDILPADKKEIIANKTEAFCARWNISLQKSTARNSHSNGHAKSSNKIIVENLRKKLEEIGGKWTEELPLVLWADRTTLKVATGQTPFSLVFGAEAVIPSKVRFPTHRYGCITEEWNQVEMASNLDTVDELRTSAQIRIASYKQTLARSYNKNVKVRTLQVGDLVLRKVFQITKNQRAGKFSYNWEGPYQVESIVGNGGYRLMTMEGQIVPRSWNIIHLKKYYI
ncbi:uncharacterized protein LOC141631767 [Silene latifolia]|uniref:uncharacterized protein LOC141631767 n=1 Tax=Silene latifolia TaxID=37657 RepID=UPI003D789845